MLRQLSNYILNRPLFFGVLLTAIVAITSSKIEQPKVSNAKPVAMTSDQAFQTESPFKQVRKVASVDIHTREVASTEFRQLQKINDDKLRMNLEGQRGAWFIDKQDHSYSIEKIENIEKRNAKKIPEKFSRNPLFKLFENFSAAEAAVDFEDPLICDSKRQFYELKLITNPIARQLSVPRKNNENEFSNHCVAFSMNQFDVPKLNYASCDNPNSKPVVSGSKPCVSQNLVNLTYNIYSDVTSCLEIDPKFLMPKIEFESGFFLNATGRAREEGLGQLTQIDLNEVNSQWSRFIEILEKKSETNASCARIRNYKDFLVPVTNLENSPCALVALPDNPLRNTWYLGVYHVILNEQIEDHFNKLNISEKLQKLGIESKHLPKIKKIISLLAHNTGSTNAVNIFNTYLEKRFEYGLLLKPEDFDFSLNKIKKDIDGKDRSEVEIARLNLLSGFISIKDSEKLKKIKLKRRRLLPAEWATAFEKSLPVFLTYHANSYDGKSTKPYLMYGYPGYLSLLSDRNTKIRNIFSNSDYGADLCTKKDFLSLGED